MFSVTADTGIEVRAVVKSYGTATVVDGVDLSVPPGTVLGLLGPNGAGKTTMVSIISTLLKPTSGAVTVAGIDALADPHHARGRIGVSGQYVSVDEILTGRENLIMVAQLAGYSRQQARVRADELVKQFDLVDAGRRRVGTYSGGMRRRIDLAGAIVARPPVVILDEPTASLDPVSRAALWGAIRDLTADGVAVLLTTQYLEEADQLADSVAVLVHGVVVARGTPQQLKRTLGTSSVRLQLSAAADEALVGEVLGLSGDCHAVSFDGDAVTFGAVDGSATMARCITDLGARGISVLDATVHTPTLDEVFVALTADSS